MKNEVEKYLIDIRLAIILVIDFVKDTPDFSTYCKDLKTKSAVERQLAIIGEAMNHIRKENLIIIQNASEIIALRNRLVHAYDSIDDSIIWVILKKHLLPLAEEIEQILDK